MTGLTGPVLFFWLWPERCQGRGASRSVPEGSRSERPKGRERRRPLTSDVDATQPFVRRAMRPRRCIALLTTKRAIRCQRGRRGRKGGIKGGKKGEEGAR